MKVLKIIWLEIVCRILLVILGILFILLGLINPDFAYETMTRAMTDDR